MLAREEFISHLESIKETDKEIRVTSAIIIYEPEYDNRFGFVFNPNYPNYSNNEFNDFLDKLNFEYNDGYGGQYIYGYIWYNNGCWSERAEYDGSEWWEYKKCPSFQDYLEELKK